MSDAIYRGYDREALDAQYFLRPQVEDFEAFVVLYQQLSREAREEFNCKLDIAYGEKPGEKLDVFMPDGAANAPVHFFIHGGYWKMMTKDEFSYVARAFTPRGCATVVVNYGLIPAVDMDELVRQCRAAMAWTYRNADTFGGDRERIFVSGHSAGGHLVAMMMATDWPEFDGRSPTLPNNLIKGGCGISGLYDLEPIRLCFLNDDLKLSQAAADRNSPLQLTPGGPGRLLLTLGGDEGPEYLRQSEDLAAAWRRHGIDVEVVVLDGQNHFTIVEQLGDPAAELSRLILEQMGQ